MHALCDKEYLECQKVSGRHQEDLVTAMQDFDCGYMPDV